MPGATTRWPWIVAATGSLLGLVFSGYSTLDYTRHLDRQLHAVHCSFIPGAGGEQVADNACRTAMYSSYSALFRDHIWGGVPVSILAVGAFSFFIAFAVYGLVAGDKAPRRANQFLALAALTPLAVSVVMAIISAVKIGSFCKTCVGIYASSAVLAVGGLAAWWLDRSGQRDAVAARAAGRDEAAAPAAAARRLGPASLIATWFGLLGLFAVAPALLYHESVPSYRSYVTGCGQLSSTDDPKKALIHVVQPGATEPAIMVVDPLCPTCAAFHQRLVAEGILPRLDLTLVLFPLDSECNWNLTTPMHPGACLVAKTVLCMEDRALSVLEWSYRDQERLRALAKGKDGQAKLLSAIEGRWSGVKSCIESKKTRMRLDETLRFAVKNKLPVSTPQLFIAGKRLCDEDSDLGLPYALRKLAPELAAR